MHTLRTEREWRWSRNIVWSMRKMATPVLWHWYQSKTVSQNDEGCCSRMEMSWMQPTSRSRTGGTNGNSRHGRGVFFVSAAWQAIRQLYPRATVKGCVFHWNQRVYRKVVNEGLATAYAANGDKFLFLRKLMSLPYLPSEHITPAFEQMMLQAEEVLIFL